MAIAPHSAEGCLLVVGEQKRDEDEGLEPNYVGIESVKQYELEGDDRRRQVAHLLDPLTIPKAHQKRSCEQIEERRVPE